MERLPPAGPVTSLFLYSHYEMGQQAVTLTGFTGYRHHATHIHSFGSPPNYRKEEEQGTYIWRCDPKNVGGGMPVLFYISYNKYWISVSSLSIYFIL